ncbi:pyridoxal-phosphate dependent enzyme [Tsukamurella soli]|uniref:pyridoxal-phosphate dependent enzyme n=1 Tax=Tsukamurella soli TaxID=644556 RepID=UPI003605C89E
MGVETEDCPTLDAALRAGRPVDVPFNGIAVDSLGAPRLGDIGFEVASTAGVESVLVSDEDAIAARDELWAERRILIEYGSAVPYAAVMSGAYRPEPGERVAVLLCGANTPRD